MTITYVGGQVGGRAGAVTAANITYALTGGIAAVPQRSDFIVVTVVVGSAGRTPACAVTAPFFYGAWSQLTRLDSNGTTYDTSLQVSYKFQAEGLDTTFQLPSTGNILDAQRYTVQVWRGVDPANPLDVAAVSATGTATGRPNPASITPTTSGAYVLICAGGAAGTGASYTAPANYTTNFLTGSTADSNDAMVGSGYRSWTSGAEDPAVYTGGTTNAADSWCAYTIALRPEIGGALRSVNVGNPRNSNGLYLTGTLPDISVGVLITGWVKMPTPPAYTYSYGNRYPFGVDGSDWFIWTIAGNMFGGVTSNVTATQNHNITLWGGMGDKLGMITELLSEAQLIDWTFIAWQFIMNSTDGFVMRQWSRFGAGSPYVIREHTMTVAEIRTAIGNPAWNPSAITRLSIGTNGLSSGDYEDYNMTRVKLYQTGSRPTEAEITALAFDSGYDTSAWAHYPLTYQDGVVDLTDHSGNSRPTLTQTGTVAPGHAIDSLPAAGTGKFVAVQSPKHVIQNATGSDVVIQFETVPTAGNLIIIEGGMTAGTPTASDSESNALTVYYSSPSNGYRPFIAYIVMPAGAASPYSVTVTGMSAGATTRGRAFEWQGNDASPFDWVVNPTTYATPLTLTAGSADTRDGTLVVTSMQQNAGWADWPIVFPADWTDLGAFSSSPDGTDNVSGPEDISTAGQSARRIFPTIGTETVTWAAQKESQNMAGVMLGFKPATTAGTLYYQAISGAMGFAGAMTRRTGRSLTGAMALSGLLNRSIARSTTGSLSFAGALVKQVRRLLSGSIALSGIVSASRLLTIALGGTLSFAGSAARRTSRSLSGSISSSGTLIKTAARGLVGSLSLAGAVTKLTSKIVSGALSLAGAVTSVVNGGATIYYQAVGGTLSFSGSVVRTTSKLVSGAVSFAGALSKRAAKVFTSVLSFAGSVSATRVILMQLAGTLAFTAGTLTKQTAKQLTSALSMSGVAIKRSSRAVFGGLSFTGDRRIITQKIVTGSLSFVGTLSSVVVQILVRGASLYRTAKVFLESRLMRVRAESRTAVVEAPVGKATVKDK